MKHASSRMLFSYWDSLRGERAAPDRGEIEPGAIRHVLADTMILEVGDAGAAKFRLAGTRVCALFGRELKGQRLETLWPEDVAQEARRYVEIVTDEMAGLVAGLTGRTEDGPIELELLLLPLRLRGKTHARILGALSASAMPPWIGLYPVTSVASASMRVIWPEGRELPSFAVTSEDGIVRRRHLVVHQGGRS